MQEETGRSNKEKLLDRVKFLKDQGRLPANIPGLDTMIKFANDGICAQVNNILDSLDAGKTPEELGLPIKDKKKD